jgi:hypothetical protein
MDDFAEWLVRHPGAVTAIVVAIGAFTVLNAYRIGVAYTNLRNVVGDNARNASEALGG